MLLISLFQVSETIYKIVSNLYWSRNFRLYHVTTILHCHWLKIWWRNTDYKDYVIILSFYLWKKQQQKIIVGANLRFSDIVVFILVAYLLNMICLILHLYHKIAYIWIFVWIWHSFKPISRDRIIIKMSYVYHLTPEILRFHSTHRMNFKRLQILKTEMRIGTPPLPQGFKGKRNRFSFEKKS